MPGNISLEERPKKGLRAVGRVYAGWGCRKPFIAMNDGKN